MKYCTALLQLVFKPGRSAPKRRNNCRRILQCMAHIFDPLHKIKRNDASIRIFFFFSAKALKPEMLASRASVRCIKNFLRKIRKRRAISLSHPPP
jgi:hypothetical protein